MNQHISPELALQFKRFGLNNAIHTGGQFYHPEEIAIGNSVYLSAPYQLHARTKNPNNETKAAIEIGDGCHINKGLQVIATQSVRFGRDVLIAPNVMISDWTVDPCNGKVGVRIGEGSWIGTNAAILGNVVIGMGSVVKPNSVVWDHVPDYCVVAGNPATIVQVYDPSSSQWVTTTTREEADQLLAARKQQPLLSICIPTYNRAACLDSCLQSIFSQISDSELIEVIISDNASTDTTPEIAQRYCALYPNVTYVRNSENIGADPNIYAAMKLGKGKFIKLQGDDDFFIDLTLRRLINVIHHHKDYGVIYINVLNGNGIITDGEGMSSYLASTSFYATFITSLVLRREELEQIAEPQKFISSCYNQLYLQYAILERNPKFCIMNCSMFSYAGMTSEIYNYAGAIIRGYLSILQHFVGKGLSEEDYAREKKYSLFHYVLPGFRAIVNGVTLSDLSGFEEIYVEYYQNEPYFEEGLEIINSIRPWIRDHQL